MLKDNTILCYTSNILAIHCYSRVSFADWVLAAGGLEILSNRLIPGRIKDLGRLQNKKQMQLGNVK